MKSFSSLVTSSPERPHWQSNCSSTLHSPLSFPVLLRGRRLPARSFRTSDRLSNAIDKAIASQYGVDKSDAYHQLDRDQRAIIVDDYHLLSHDAVTRRATLQYLTRLFATVYLFGDSLAQDLQDIDNHHRLLDDSSRAIHFRIQVFGYQRRDSLIQRWVSLHSSQAADVGDLARRVRVANQVVSTVIGNNLIPSYPVYILAVLQGNENLGSVDLRASANAHYYELFIKNGLALTSESIGLFRQDVVSRNSRL